VHAPTLRQLEYVVAVAETGQFVEAARRCGVSQPALSKQVREVEELLGVELFERVRPRVIVTPTGEEIVRRARRLLGDARELVLAAQEGPAVLRLGVIPTIAPYGLPGVLAKLRRSYPDLVFAIHELQTEVLLERLGDGSVDVALLARPFDDHGLHATDLVDEPFVLVAPRKHPLGVRRPVAVAELSGESLILMEDGHCLRDQAMEVCALAGVAPTPINAASVSTLARMVESGLGATLLPASALRTEVRAGQGLVARSFGARPPGRTLTLAWRATTANAEWFERVADVLREHYLGLNGSFPKVAGDPPRMVDRGSRA